MCGAVVRLDLVGVQVLDGRIDVPQVRLPNPVQGILRGGGADRAKAFGLPRLAVGHARREGAPVRAILLAHRIPEGQVLRVEGAVGDRGLVAGDAEADAVGRLEHVQPMRLADDDALVARVLRAVGIGVLEDRRMGRIAANRGHALGREDNVVLLRALELEQAQFRPPPMDAVVAFHITEEPGVVGPGLGRLASVPIVPGVVVHAVQLAVLEHARVATGVSFPGGVGLEHDFLRHGLMELQPSPAGKLFHEEIVHQQFAAIADRDGGAGILGIACGHRRQQQNSQQGLHRKSPVYPMCNAQPCAVYSTPMQRSSQLRKHGSGGKAMLEVAVGADDFVGIGLRRATIAEGSGFD